MALLKCPDCGNMVSDKAAACPECGCPIEDIKKANEKNIAKENNAVEEKNSAEEHSTAEEKNPAEEHNAEEHNAEKNNAQKKKTPDKNSKKKIIATIIIAAAIAVAAIFGVRGIQSYRSAHASQLLHDWTFISLVYTQNGEQQEALDTASFTNVGQSAPTLTVNKDGTYELTALGTEYSGKWTRYSDEEVSKLSGVKQAYSLENSQGLLITALIQDDAVGDDNTADAVTVVITGTGSESSSSGSTETAFSEDYYAFLFERTGN